MQIHYLKTVFVIGICLISPFAQAQTDQTLINNVVKNLSLQTNAVDAEFTVTKPHPENKNATIVLLALPQGEEDDVLTFDIYLVLADQDRCCTLLAFGKRALYLRCHPTNRL